LKKENKFVIDKFNSSEVIAELKAIDENSSKGSVNISPKVLKNCAEEIGPFLTKLFNLCLLNRKIPDDWKIAHIIPNFKGTGSKSDFNNYRPISIIPPIAKVFEALVTKRMLVYLERNNILHDFQYGYREGRSCESALNVIMEDWRGALDKKYDIVSVFLDLSKAFDTIDHQLLLMKLKLYNFHDESVELLKDYLKNRKISVDIDGNLSKTEVISVGVPQGSVLGPLLFIIFFNDIGFLKLAAKEIGFADDTTIYFFGPKLNAIISDISIDLLVIKNWLDNNRLILNLTKTTAMHLSLKSDKLEKLKLPILTCGSIPIKFQTEVRLLGIVIDNQLKFSAQTMSLCKKINSKSYLLSKTIHLFSVSIRPIIFKLFIQSHFDYCSSLYLHINNIDISRLDKTFNRAIERILKIRISQLYPIQQYPILIKFNILPRIYRQLYHFSFFVYKIVNRKNSYLYDKIKIFSKSENAMSLGRSSRLEYIVPEFSSKFKKFSFSRVAILNLNLFIQNFIRVNEEKRKEKKTPLSFKTFLLKNIDKLSKQLISFIT